jgi:hypothetical protein
MRDYVEKASRGALYWEGGCLEMGGMTPLHKEKGEKWGVEFSDDCIAVYNGHGNGKRELILIQVVINPLKSLLPAIWSEDLLVQHINNEGTKMYGVERIEEKEAIKNYYIGLLYRSAIMGKRRSFSYLYNMLLKYLETRALVEYGELEREAFRD